MIVRAGRVFVECENRDKQYCVLKCGNLDFECINNKCVCVKAYKSSTSRFEMRGKKLYYLKLFKLTLVCTKLQSNMIIEKDYLSLDQDC